MIPLSPPDPSWSDGLLPPHMDALASAVYPPRPRRIDHPAERLGHEWRRSALTEWRDALPLVRSVSALGRMLGLAQPIIRGYVVGTPIYGYRWPGLVSMSRVYRLPPAVVGPMLTESAARARSARARGLIVDPWPVDVWGDDHMSPAMIGRQDAGG